MSSTRKKQPEDNSPLSQQRYMSSPEYAELRGVSGTAVAPRATIVDDPAIRRLLWFLQAKSLEPGGLKQVAREILEQYASRIGTPAMHKFGIKPGQVYNAQQVKVVRKECSAINNFPLRGEALDDSFYGVGSLYEVAEYLLRAGQLEGDERERAQRHLVESRRHPTSYPASAFVERCQSSPQRLAEFLTDLCVNPRLAISRTGESSKQYEQRLESEYPDQNLSVHTADLWWFQDIIGALLEYQRGQESAARADFVLTAVGRKVWETLDFAVKARRMVVIEGWEGRGKTEAVKAWWRCHRGDACFVDLAGVTSKTTVFRAIAKANGIGSSYSRTATEMQSRIEDVLQRSRRLVIFDEAHFLLNQSARMYSRPELIDWIDTALCNNDVPVALITTPQFIQGVKRAETQVGWNWRQFRRRVRRWVQLPQWNTDADLENVAHKIFPGLSRAGIKLALGYAKISLHGSPSRDISGLGDVATEARIIAEEDGRDVIKFEDVERALKDHLMPSDEVFASRMAAPVKRPRRTVSTPLQGALTTPSEPLLDSNGDDETPEDFQRHKPARIANPGRAVTPRARGDLVAA